MFDEIKRTVENARILDGLNEQLVNALFAPAEKAGIFAFSSKQWKNPSSKYKADYLLDQILPLSEFYQEINPPLSAALWGIWNTVRYLRSQRSLFSILGESKKTNDQMFFAIRALIATAAVQFSDGTAFTVATSDAMSNISDYKKNAEQAISNLSKIGLPE
ncbi:MAG: hypothetical protein ACOY32_12755 [Thermodesulfobacteriota bacterium]